MDKTLSCRDVVCRGHHECVHCGRPVCPGEPAMRVVRLTYTGGKRNEVWSEYNCCKRSFR